MWSVRAGEKGRLFEQFKEKRVVAVGWLRDRDLSDLKADQIREMMIQEYPQEKPRRLQIWANELIKFIQVMKQGERVTTFDSRNRKYWVGEIVGDYKYDPKFEYHQTRPVNWTREIPREMLTTSTKNSLGAISTLFRVPEEAEKELLSLMDSKRAKKAEPVDREELEEEKLDVEAKAAEFIKDKIAELDAYEAQDLVAGLLRAMGYKTTVSLPGTDKGIDVEASPDGLFMKEPRIIVQVKHRKGQVSREEMSSFIGKVRAGMNGLYVSSGGFTKPAMEESNGAQYRVRLLDLDDLVELVTQYYDSFDSEARSLLPLSKIYWPL